MDKAGGEFIYAATVLKYVGDPHSLPTTKLQHILEISPGSAPFAQLDQLFRHSLMGSPRRQRSTVLHIFGFVFLHNPKFETIFNISVIEAVLGLRVGEGLAVLREMHAIVGIKSSSSGLTARFPYASFRDFIFNQERSGEFYIDRPNENLFIATKCIDYLGYCNTREWCVESSVIRINAHVMVK